MNGTIYDFAGLPRAATLPADAPARAPSRLRAVPAPAPERVGMITNPRSHRNKRGLGESLPRADVLTAAPRSRAELRDVLRRFADERLDLLVIDGGDGTVRDVLTCAEDAWGTAWPKLAVLPSGKTNALALDLGVPAGWTLDQALAAARAGRTVTRSPIEIARRGEPGIIVRGFLFGSGAFVQATALAQRTHRAGAFNGVAVAMTLVGAIGQTLLGSAEGGWRRGERMRVRFDPRSAAMHGAPLESDRHDYLLLASTLERMPLGVRPFGKVRPGLKTLSVEAPPRRMVAAVPALLGGSEPAWLEAAGYHRVDAPAVELDLAGRFILDGEIFPAGSYRLVEAPPLSFVVP